MQVIKQPERGRTSTTEEKKYLPFKQNFVPVDNFNTNNKNDSPNKLIIVKKSRQTDQNDKSCKKFFFFVNYRVIISEIKPKLCTS